VGLDDTLCYQLQIAVMLPRNLAGVKPSGVPPSRSLDYPQQRKYHDHDQYDQQHVDHSVQRHPDFSFLRPSPYTFSPLDDPEDDVYEQDYHQHRDHQV
jgi:hypothetical protein